MSAALKARLFAAVATVGLFGAAANADELQITYTGTVTSYVDPSLLFGPGNLVGDSYQAALLYSTSSVVNVPNESYTIAGTLITANVTINGVTLSLGTQVSQIDGAPNYQGSLFTNYDNSLPPGPNVNYNIYMSSNIQGVGGTTIPYSLVNPFTYNAPSGDVAGSSYLSLGYSTFNASLTGISISDPVNCFF